MNSHMPFLERIGRWLAHYLSHPRRVGDPVATFRPELLTSTLQKGDVLLVEGTSRFSVAIKFLTQSTWSHATLFVGDALGPPDPGEEAHVLI